MSDNPPSGELAGLVALFLLAVAFLLVVEAHDRLRATRRRTAAKRRHPASADRSVEAVTTNPVPVHLQCQREDCVDRWQFVIHGWRLCVVHGADVVAREQSAAVLTVAEPITAAEAEALAAKWAEGVARGRGRLTVLPAEPPLCDYTDEAEWCYVHRSPWSRCASRCDAAQEARA